MGETINTETPGVIDLIGTAQTAVTNRHAYNRYSHKVSDVLAAELANYVDYDATDLTAEMGILRMQVGQALTEYDQINSVDVNLFPGDTPAFKQQSKATLLELVTLKLNSAIEKVREYALTMSKIQAARNGKLDYMVVSQIATNLAQQFELMLAEYGGQYSDRTNKPFPMEAASHRVGSLLESEFSRLRNGSNGSSVASGPVISSQPARISAEDILRDMVTSVPYCEPRPENTADADGIIPQPTAKLVPFAVPQVG